VARGGKGKGGGAGSRGDQPRDREGQFASKGSGGSSMLMATARSAGSEGGSGGDKHAALRARVKAASAALSRSRSSMADSRALRRAASEGLRGVPIRQTGLRPESFTHLRAGGAVHGGPPKVTIYPGGKRVLTDGRHRITLARERGESTIDALVSVMGARGGIRKTRKMRIPI
jgi:hypothetical protein